MPGLFGIIGDLPNLADRFVNEINNVWSNCSWSRFDGGLVGGHSLSPQSNVIENSNSVMVVDGESSAIELAASTSGKVLRDLKEPPCWPFDSVGNGLFYDKQRKTIFLFSSILPGPPLYYYQHRK